MVYYPITYYTKNGQFEVYDLLKVPFDELHRIDGPAYEDASGKYNRWFLNGKYLGSREVDEWIKENNIDLSTDAGQIAFKLRWE